MFHRGSLNDTGAMAVALHPFAGSLGRSRVIQVALRNPRYATQVCPRVRGKRIGTNINTETSPSGRTWKICASIDEPKALVFFHESPEHYDSHATVVAIEGAMDRVVATVPGLHAQ